MSHRRLIRGTIFTIIGLAMYGSTGFVFNVVVGRFYGPDVLGEVNTALSTALLLSYFVSTGFPGAIAKYISEYRGRNRNNVSNLILKISIMYSTLILMFITILVIIFSRNISSLLNVPYGTFILAAPIIFFYGMYMVFKMTYYGFGKIEKYFRNEIYSDSIFFISLGIIVFTDSKYGIFIPFLLMYICFIFSSILFFRKNIFSPRMEVKSIKNLKKMFFMYVGISFIGTFSSMARKNLSFIISSYYLSSVNVGYLSAAFSISTIFYLFPNAISRVIMPEFSYAFGKKDINYLVKLLNKATEYLVIFSTLLIAIGIIFADYLIQLFYSGEYVSSVIILQILLLSFWISIVGRPAISVLSGTKYVHIPNAAGLVGLMVSLGVWICIIPVWGVIGTVLGYFAGIFINIVLILIYAKHYYSLKCNIIFMNFSFLLFLLILIIIDKYLYLPIIIIALILYIFYHKKYIIVFLRSALP